MDGEIPDKDVTRLGRFAGGTFLNIEILAYIVLGLLLTGAALLGIVSAGLSLWAAVEHRSEANVLILAIDRLLFVLMVVEVLHTVRVSFRAGKLAAEPFLIVGLIASIRRVLVITLESAQVNQPALRGEGSQTAFYNTMIELGVLGGLILVMVISIWMIRHSEAVKSR